MARTMARAMPRGTARARSLTKACRLTWPLPANWGCSSTVASASSGTFSRPSSPPTGASWHFRASTCVLMSRSDKRT
eukprot:767519-Hanusia_phi.AAC.7